MIGRELSISNNQLFFAEQSTLEDACEPEGIYTDQVCAKKLFDAIVSLDSHTLGVVINELRMGDATSRELAKLLSTQPESQSQLPELFEDWKAEVIEHLSVSEPFLRHVFHLVRYHTENPSPIAKYLGD